MRKSKSAVIMLLVSIVVAIFITYKLVGAGSVPFDQSSFAFIRDIFPQSMQPLFIFITFFGSKYGFAIVGIALILWLWFWKKDFIGIATVVAAVAIGNELNLFFKDVILRPRPKLEHLVEVNSYSFPSGHAMVGLILYMIFAYFVIGDLQKLSTKWLVGLVFGLWILLIGVSRIVLQVHYPSDVLSGFALGYIWTYLMILGYEFLRFKKRV